jgi:hypothetical protein
MAMNPLPADVRPAKRRHALGGLSAATERALAPRTPANDQAATLHQLGAATPTREG